MVLFYLYTNYGRARIVFDRIYIVGRHWWRQGHKFVRWSGHDMSTYAVVIRHCEYFFYGSHPIKLANVGEIDATCMKAILPRESIMVSCWTQSLLRSWLGRCDCPIIGFVVTRARELESSLEGLQE